MSTFTYNQFKNPTNEGIYYSNHFHNLETGISHPNNQQYPGYKAVSCGSRCGGTSSNDPRMNQRIYVKENNSFPDNNKPIIRKQPNSNNAVSNDFISPTIITQPITRDDSEKYFPSLPKIPISSGETIANKKWRNILFDKVAGVTGTIGVYSSSSDRINLRITQNGLTLQSATGDGTGIDLSSVSLNDIGEGLTSYLDYDQTTTEDVNGIKIMNILPLKEPGPPTSFSVGVNLSGGISGTNITEGILSALNRKPPIMYHGKPTQRANSNSLLNGKFTETYMADISGDHYHYFPIRDNIINGYVANHVGQVHTGKIPSFPNSKISKYYSTKKPHMNLKIAHSHPVNFRLF
jgi:hypothetical protein